jgi:hypothetical protein
LEYISLIILEALTFSIDSPLILESNFNELNILNKFSLSKFKLSSFKSFTNLLLLFIINFLFIWNFSFFEILFIILRNSPKFLIFLFSSGFTKFSNIYFINASKFVIYLLKKSI